MSAQKFNRYWGTDKMISMILTTFRKDPTSERRMLWADLRIFLNSVEAYGLEYLHEVIIAWDGPWAPDDMPQHPKLKYMQRPPGLDQTDATIWAIERSEGDELIQASDDSVLTPTTMQYLTYDRDYIKANNPELRIGAMGVRSNWVVGMQNIRTPNDGELGKSGVEYSSEWSILIADKLHSVLIYYPREVWEEMGRFPKGLGWFGDVLFSYDLRQAGYTLFVSRAYAHHIGMRGTKSAGHNTESMHKAGVQWLRENRPDFLEYWIKEGYIDPSERFASV